MILHRLLGRGPSILLACIVVTFATRAVAQPNPGLSQLGGWVYIDRNDDGILAFSNQANPEFAIPDVSISLFSKVGTVETLVSTMLTDPNGRYLFPNINPGTYVLRQTQPAMFVDGKDTLGVLQAFNGGVIAPPASPGTAGNNFFTDIVLTPNIGGEFYNFGERGLTSAFVSKRFLFASAPPLPPVTPEPGAVGLIVAAVVGLWCRRRSR
jgi:MYXO-CTERM domain-containing protein